MLVCRPSSIRTLLSVSLSLCVSPPTLHFPSLFSFLTLSLLLAFVVMLLFLLVGWSVFVIEVSSVANSMIGNVCVFDCRLKPFTAGHFGSHFGSISPLFFSRVIALIKWESPLSAVNSLLFFLLRVIITCKRLASLNRHTSATRSSR